MHLVYLQIQEMFQTRGHSSAKLDRGSTVSSTESYVSGGGTFLHLPEAQCFIYKYFLWRRVRLLRDYCEN